MDTHVERTIDAVVRRLKSIALDLRKDDDDVSRNLADSIELAAEEVDALNRYDGKCNCSKCGFRKSTMCYHFDLQAENARLRAALKPVIECSCEVLHLGDAEIGFGSLDAIDAVTEARRIFKESEVK